MPLIKHGAATDDPWVTVGDEDPISLAGRAIVSLTRWQAERDDLLRRNAPLGIRLRSDQAPSLIAEDLDHFALVALEFPKFTDGRAYSYARLLRERYGFAGELRAVGNVLRDQLLFMARCGFDAFEVPADAPIADWLRAVGDFSVRYQPAWDAGASAPTLRRRWVAGGSNSHIDGQSAAATEMTKESGHPAAVTAPAGTQPGAASDEPCAANWAY